MNTFCKKFTIFIALFGGWIWQSLGIETLFIASAVLGFPINYFITYPFYAATMIPMDTIICTPFLSDFLLRWYHVSAEYFVVTGRLRKILASCPGRVYNRSKLGFIVQSLPLGEGGFSNSPRRRVNWKRRMRVSLVPN